MAKYVHEIVCNVRIFLLDPAAPRSGAPRAFLAAPAPVAHDEAILDFFCRINIAVLIVREQYPGAQLHQVEATPNHPGGVTHPNELAHLKAVFSAQKNGTQGIVIIETVGWEAFGPVRFIPSPPLDDAVIPWPPTGLKTINEANAILNNHGYTQPFLSVDFRQALNTGVTEPFHIFHLEDGPFGLVGAKDGKILVDEDDITDDWTSVPRPLQAVYR